MSPTSRPHQASLSISSLARKLCSNGCAPEAETSLSSLINKLSQPLGISCETRSREEREEVIFWKIFYKLFSLPKLFVFL